ncbi:hypothetical protein DdX_18891 [Ditylenchus destructor]|uniref:Uncharacterized protein n=1 Tax=Ditylenchus destructor TaxID=166010 RepID=A0AAD4MLG8_9BILA|nr:hypothetical protein DdX_18891 [Ditylenchus destructor]
MNPDRGRLQCKKLNIYLNADTGWIKDHVRCNEMLLDGFSVTNCDEELLDFFTTASPCTSAIYAINYDLSKVIVDLVQKFTGLKNRDEYGLVESIRGDIKDEGVVEVLKRKCAEFIAEEDQIEEDRGTIQVIGIVNNDIGKKLTLNAKNFSYGRGSYFSIQISNL